MELLEDLDLRGSNLLLYDVPLLIAEFARACLKFPVEGRRIVDAQRIFHCRATSRTWTAALQFDWAVEAHADADGAEADAIATLRGDPRGSSRSTRISRG